MLAVVSDGHLDDITAGQQLVTTLHRADCAVAAGVGRPRPAGVVCTSWNHFQPSGSRPSRASRPPGPMSPSSRGGFGFGHQRKPRPVNAWAARRPLAVLDDKFGGKTPPPPSSAPPTARPPCSARSTRATGCAAPTSTRS